MREKKKQDKKEIEGSARCPKIDGKEYVFFSTGAIYMNKKTWERVTKELGGKRLGKGEARMAAPRDADGG